MSRGLVRLLRSTMDKLLIVRVDASVAMGTGHVMRMIALAQAWRESGGIVVFLSAEITPALEQRIREEKFQIEKLPVVPGSLNDLAATSAFIRQRGTDHNSIFIVLDGYQFDAGFQVGLKKGGHFLLVVDDYGHCSRYHANLVLNQNISADLGFYHNRSPETRLLLGCRYLLLRREFLKYQGWSREIPDVARKILVSLGGADAQNITYQAIKALSALDVDAKVVVGGSNPHFASLSQIAEESCAGPAARIELVVDSEDMPGLMAWADVAVAAGGSTSYEMACMGLPCVSVIVADNQLHAASRLASTGASVCLGWAKDITVDCYRKALTSLMNDRERRIEMSRYASSLVDFDGAARVLSAIEVFPECSTRA